EARLRVEPLLAVDEPGAIALERERKSQVAGWIGEVSGAHRGAVVRAERAEGGAAEAEVVVPAPVAEVMAGFVSGARVVRYLVVREAPGGELLLDREEGLGDGVLGRDREP